MNSCDTMMRGGSMKRCAWAYSDILIKYHDEVWGKEEHDDKKLYKMLILEGLQAGLSWEIILKKEEAYENAIDHFDYHKIALYDDIKIIELLNTPGLIKNTLKMNAIVKNAKAFIKIQEEFGSFDYYIWSYVHHASVKHCYAHSSDVPTCDELSTVISKDLKKRGFSFVGPTIIYSYLQAIGIYNDHEIECDLY